VTVTFSDIDGTLVHYPTSQPGEPYEDEHGSITQESVHPGFSLYTDKVLHMGSVPWSWLCTPLWLMSSRHTDSHAAAGMHHTGRQAAQGAGAAAQQHRPPGAECSSACCCSWL
jgi:hypothetical protein